MSIFVCLRFWSHSRIFNSYENVPVTTAKGINFHTTYWLCIVYLLISFLSCSRIFHSYPKVSIVGELLQQSLIREGSLSCLYRLWHRTSVYKVSSEGPPLRQSRDTEDLVLPDPHAIVQRWFRSSLCLLIPMPCPHADNLDFLPWSKIGQCWMYQGILIWWPEVDQFIFNPFKIVTSYKYEKSCIEKCSCNLIVELAFI